MARAVQGLGFFGGVPARLGHLEGFLVRQGGFTDVAHGAEGQADRPERPGLEAAGRLSSQVIESLAQDRNSLDGLAFAVHPLTVIDEVFDICEESGHAAETNGPGTPTGRLHRVSAASAGCGAWAAAGRHG